MPLIGALLHDRRIDISIYPHAHRTFHEQHAATGGGDRMAGFALAQCDARSGR
jgi:hypothetical protein